MRHELTYYEWVTMCAALGRRRRSSPPAASSISLPINLRFAEWMEKVVTHSTSAESQTGRMR